MINVNNRIVDEISTISVANDKEVVKLDFKIKNQVTELLKLTDCIVFINYLNGGKKDRYAVTDLTESGGFVTFSWTLGANATAKQGKTHFVICAQKMNGATVEQEWNSVLTSFNVEKGLEAITQPTTEMQDLFAQLVEMINAKVSPENIKGGENVTVEIDGEDVIINSDGGGVKNYKDLLGLPRTLYTPTGDSVEIANIPSGIYDAGKEFAITSNNESISLDKGSVFAVNHNNNEHTAIIVNGNVAESGIIKADSSGNSSFALIDLLNYDFSEFATSSELTDEKTARQNADNDLQEQIDAITVSSDVIDVVGTYADLQNYDTQHVKANDIIKVMQDSTHGDATSYYRWVITEGIGAWVYVGSEGPYYTKGETNTLLQGKLDIAQGSGNEGKIPIVNSQGNLELADIQNDGTPIKFVTSLPTSNIDPMAVYNIRNNNIFPEVASIATVNDYCVIVTYTANDGYKLRYVEATSSGGSIGVQRWSGGSLKKFVYRTYHSNNGFWVLDYDSETESNQCFQNIVWNTVVYSNYTIVNGYVDDTYYDIANNQTDIYGVPLNASQTYQFRSYQRNSDNTDWTLLGISDYTELFDGIATDNDLALKVNTSAIKQSTGSGTTDLMSQNAITSELAKKCNKPLFFTNINVVANDWQGNTFTTETFEGDGETTNFTLQGTVASGTPTVKVDGTATTDFTYASGVITFTTAPANEAEIEVIYNITPETYFEEYDYKAVITCQGVTADMGGQVIFADEQAKSGDYAFTAKTGSGTVTIFSNDNSAITIPTIIAGSTVNVEQSGHNYSTDEQVVGTWFGKPLYEKTFLLKRGVNLPTLNNGFNNVLLGDGGSAFDILFLHSGFIFGRWVSNNNPYCYSLGGAETVDTNPMYANMIFINQSSNDNSVTMRLYLYELATTTYVPIDQIVATIRYTKSTDTAEVVE